MRSALRLRAVLTGALLTFSWSISAQAGETKKTTQIVGNSEICWETRLTVSTANSPSSSILHILLLDTEEPRVPARCDGQSSGEQDPGGLWWIDVRTRDRIDHLKSTKVTERVEGDPHREGDGRVPLASAALDV